ESHREFPCFRARAVRFRKEKANCRYAWRAEMRPPVQVRASFRMICSSLRRILLELRQLRIHVVPWLCIGSPHIHVRFEQTGVIQTGRGNALAVFTLPAEKA